MQEDKRQERRAVGAGSKRAAPNASRVISAAPAASRQRCSSKRHPRRSALPPSSARARPMATAARAFTPPRSTPRWSKPPPHGATPLDILTLRCGFCIRGLHGVCGFGDKCLTRVCCQRRAITVIPEINMPAHARAAVMSMEARYHHYAKAGDLVRHTTMINSSWTHSIVAGGVTLTHTRARARPLTPPRPTPPLHSISLLVTNL